MDIEKKEANTRFVNINDKNYKIYDISKVAEFIGLDLYKLPYSLRILFENNVRNGASKERLSFFQQWIIDKKSSAEINYNPNRVLMQDFTGVPAIVDLAAMRDAIKKTGKNPNIINPVIPVDLVIDHSVQVDLYGSNDAFLVNEKKELERNIERYEFLKWGQKSFANFRVVPPGTGICHQVNLEYLAKTVWNEDNKLLYPDTIVGTDSHTTMVNALSVLGWGVGGIEAEAAMLGKGLSMVLPEVIGVKFVGIIKNDITATDLVLTVTEKLRKKGVVGKFVEFFGPGLDNLSLADRATIANMAPEYGATCGFFPIDKETINYLKFTGRSDDHVNIVESYAKIQHLWRTSCEPQYTDVIEIDLSSISISLSGPKRPQDRVNLENVAASFVNSLPNNKELTNNIKYQYDKLGNSIMDGSVVIAAITSCTNTSNPSVMFAAAIMARKAVTMGLRVKPWVKTSLAPGSQIVKEYLFKSGLNVYLDQLGFNLIAYGCTTCIGNSGPLDSKIEKVIIDNSLVVASVLSGNRNFEGRIHPLVKANYLASPPLVIAYAIAGTVNINLYNDPIAFTNERKAVYLRDILPSKEEIDHEIKLHLNKKMFLEKYSNVFKGNQLWENIAIVESDTYNWNNNSTYIKKPPYFDKNNISPKVSNIHSARILALLGDSITTDHISPAGNISKDSVAGQYLISNNVSPEKFNSYGSRRGNHEVMMRGTFANIRIKNLLCPEIEGGFTIDHITGEQKSIYDAAMEYQKKNIPLVIFAGKEYGTGSSRDWAAKGTSLLGVKAVIAVSFERIHRSNLIGMCVLPITLECGLSWKDLNIKGTEEISILGLNNTITPYTSLSCTIKRDGDKGYDIFNAVLQVYTDTEIEYLNKGGIFKTIISEMI